VVRIIYLEVPNDYKKKIKQHLLDHDIKDLKTFVIDAMDEKIQRDSQRRE